VSNLKENFSEEDFYDKLIYSKQFGDDNYKLVFHIVNVCLQIEKTKKKLLKVISRYTNITQLTIENLNKILDSYDINQKDIFRLNCFTQIEELLSPEDMYFYKSIKCDKKRLVTLNEYKFMLQRITKHVYRDKDRKVRMLNAYFLESGFEQTYKEKMTKSLDGNKLAHILKVLQKHNYLHITNNSKNERVVQIGPNNPFYMLKSVPDAEEQDVDTANDRMISKLVSENEMMKSAVKTLRQELTDALEQKDRLEGELEESQNKNDLLVEMIDERDKDLELFTSDLTYNTDGSFVACKLNDCIPVKLSLN